jgi:Zn-dependent protease
MQGTFYIFYFIVLIFSIIVHEVAHGIIAEREGDPTARLQGRITLNPLKHIDIFGSIVLPLILILSNAGVVVGWAKPVPYNPENVENGRKSVAKVAIAGIIVNLSIAIVFGLLIRIGMSQGVLSQSMVELASIVVLVNTVLALFNAIPLPPLDGFNFLSSVLPYRYVLYIEPLQRYGMILLIVFIFFGWRVVAPLAFNFYTLLTGIVV